MGSHHYFMNGVRLYNIHRLYEKCAYKGQDKHKIFKMKVDRSDKAGSGNEKKQPIQTGIFFLLLFHALRDLCKNRRIASGTKAKNDASHSGTLTLSALRRLAGHFKKI
jgi:hypothetical protein